MSKQKITAEEKHYIKLNNKLRKEINELRLANAKLLDANKLLTDKNNSLEYTIAQQKDWIERLCDCVKMTPEAFKLWVENQQKQTQLELTKQENIKFIKEFITRSTNLFNL